MSLILPLDPHGHAAALARSGRTVDVAPHGASILFDGWWPVLPDIVSINSIRVVVPRLEVERPGRRAINLVQFAVPRVARGGCANRSAPSHVLLSLVSHEENATAKRSHMPLRARTDVPMSGHSWTWQG